MKKKFSVSTGILAICLAALFVFETIQIVSVVTRLSLGDTSSGGYTSLILKCVVGAVLNVIFIIALIAYPERKSEIK